MTPETTSVERSWARVASSDRLRRCTDRRPVRLDPGGLPSPAWLFGAPNHRDTDLGRGDSARTLCS